MQNWYPQTYLIRFWYLQCKNELINTLSGLAIRSQNASAKKQTRRALYAENIFYGLTDVSRLTGTRKWKYRLKITPIASAARHLVSSKRKRNVTSQMYTMNCCFSSFTFTRNTNYTTFIRKSLSRRISRGKEL